MPAELVANDSTVLTRTPDAEERALADALDRWAPGAPAFDGPLAGIADEAHPRRRRDALWTLLAEQEHSTQKRLLEAIIGAAYREDPAGLRLLFSFLCGRPRSVLYPERVATLRHLDRLGRRLLLVTAPASDEETAWLAELLAIVEPMGPPEQFQSSLAGPRDALRALLAAPEGMPHPLPDALARLLLLEGRAASLRGARLVDQVGDYDPAALARLLPLVVALDEWQGDLQALVERGARGFKHPLEQYLGEEELVGWRRALNKGESLPSQLLSGWVNWMSSTELVGDEPTAWVGLLRTLGGRRYRKTLHAALLLPLRWRQRRLGLGERPPRTLFRASAVSESEGLYWVDLDALLWSEWVSPDGCPMSPEGWRDEGSPLLMLRSRLQDDAFCERILDNEQWSQRHGVVEAIARGSRSLKVLLRIARERRLHSGAACRGVPLALLENPTGIPLSALRTFLGPRYISRHDFTRLARGSSGVRQEIVHEARQLQKHN